MAKAKTTVYFCKECGYESAKWMGQCPGCRQWNTFVEEPVGKKADGVKRFSVHGTENQKPSRLSDISTEQEERSTTGI